jgi:hypothetical protein
MSIAATIGWGLVLILFAVSLWIRRQRRARGRSFARLAPTSRLSGPIGQKPSEVLVWINDDGSARELSEAEKTYVDAEYSPFDGARPYIKSHYAQRNGWGELSGYLPRKDVPDREPIGPAPAESSPQQQTPQAVAESILELVRKHRPDDADKIRFKLPRDPA